MSVSLVVMPEQQWRWRLAAWAASDVLLTMQALRLGLVLLQ